MKTGATPDHMVRRGAYCSSANLKPETATAVFGAHGVVCDGESTGNGCDFLDDMLQYKHKLCLTTYQATEKPDDRGKGESAQ